MTSRWKVLKVLALKWTIQVKGLESFSPEVDYHHQSSKSLLNRCFWPSDKGFWRRFTLGSKSNILKEPSVIPEPSSLSKTPRGLSPINAQDSIQTLPEIHQSSLLKSVITTSSFSLAKIFTDAQILWILSVLKVFVVVLVLCILSAN